MKRPFTSFTVQFRQLAAQTGYLGVDLLNLSLHLLHIRFILLNHLFIAILVRIGNGALLGAAFKRKRLPFPFQLINFIAQRCIKGLALFVLFLA